MFFNKSIALIIGGGLLVGGIIWYISSLKSEISELKEKHSLVVAEKDNEIRRLNLELAHSTIELNTERGNRIELQNALNNTKTMLESIVNDKDKSIEKEYEDSKANRTPIINVNGSTCQDIINFNNELSEIKYEDL